MKMKKHIGYGIAVCLLLLQGMAMAVTTEWANPAPGDWATASNWATGNVPTSLDDTRIRPPGSSSFVQVTLDSAGAAGRLLLDNGTGLTVAANGILTVGNVGRTQLGNATTSLGSTITIDGGQMSVASEVIIGERGSGMLTVNSGTFSVGGAWLIPGYVAGGYGHITVNGGALNTAGHIYTGLNGSGDLTVGGGNVYVGGTLIVANSAASVSTIAINGGVTSVGGLDFGRAGTQTLDLNGGQLITRGGFAAGVNNTFYIGSGELVFGGGQSLYDIQNLVAGANWVFDDTASVFEREGTVVVTSIPEPATIGLLGLFGGALIAIRRYRLI